MQRTLLILLVTLTVAFGATAVAAADHATVEVDQEPGEPATVTVTDANNQSVENASVAVSLAADDEPDYEGANETYTTDENGTAELPAPEETVDVNITATYQGDETSVVETLEADRSVDDDDSFGQAMATFVTEVRNGTNGQLDGPFGHIIATFAVQNNPGNAPAHAGPPENTTQGPPDHAGPDSDDERGPPAHAGPDGNDTDAPDDSDGVDADQNGTSANDGEETVTDDESDQTEDDATDEAENNPPAHAGPP